jgi:hypothetical protein
LPYLYARSPYIEICTKKIPKSYGPKGLKHEILENCTVFDSAEIRYATFKNSAYAQPAMEFILRMLSQRLICSAHAQAAINYFRACSASVKIRSAYAQHIFEGSLLIGFWFLL